MIFDKRDLMAAVGARGGFIFLDSPMKQIKVVNKPCRIDLTKENTQNLARYATKLKYDKGIQPNYDNHIQNIVGEYLEETLTPKDIKEMEKMIAEEKRAIEQAKEKEKPRFSWDLSKNKKQDKKGSK